MKLQKRRANGKIYYFGICEIDKKEIEPKMAFTDWICEKFTKINNKIPNSGVQDENVSDGSAKI